MKIKSVKPGFNVLTETDPRNINLDSDLFEAVMRIQTAGQGSVNLAAGAGSVATVTINHALGYPPFFQLFCRWKWNSGGTVSNIEPATSFAVGFNGSFAGQILSQPKVTDQDLILRFQNQGGLANMGVDYFYFIGRDPLTRNG